MSRAVWVAVAFAIAAGGIVLYAVAPGVGSYQASIYLTLPALIVVLVWLHRHLPMWLQWGCSVALVAVGPIGYLVWAGDQWWNWGQATPLPFVMLVISQGRKDDGESCSRSGSQASYGGYADGPWGPP
jgi:hypothetical protein